MRHVGGLFGGASLVAIALLLAGPAAAQGGAGPGRQGAIGQLSALPSAAPYHQGQAQGHQGQAQGQQEQAQGQQGQRSGQPGQNVILLMPASEIVGRELRDPQNRPAGRIDQIVLDTRNGAVDFVMVVSNGNFNIGGGAIAVPWQALRPPTSASGPIIVNVPAPKLAKAPRIGTGRLANLVNRPARVWGWYGYGYPPRYAYGANGYRGPAGYFALGGPGYGGYGNFGGSGSSAPGPVNSANGAPHYPAGRNGMSPSNGGTNNGQPNNEGQGNAGAQANNGQGHNAQANAAPFNGGQGNGGQGNGGHGNGQGSAGQGNGGRAYYGQGNGGQGNYGGNPGGGAQANAGQGGSPGQQPTAHQLVAQGLVINRNGAIKQITSRQTASQQTLQGANVYAHNGNFVGTIDQVMIDVAHGEVAFALLSRGGFLGLNQSWYALPIEALTWAPSGQGEYRLTVDERRLNSEPAIQITQLNTPVRVNAQHIAALYRHFGMAPYLQNRQAG